MKTKKTYKIRSWEFPRGHDNVYEVIMNNSHEYYQKAKKENNDKIESLFYYIVNNQELLAKDRAEILLNGSVRVENVPWDAT